MKICFLGDGNSIHVQRWLKFFVQRNHEVHLITFSQINMKGIYVHQIHGVDINMNGGNWRYLLYVNKIRKLIKDINPSIINAHYVTSYGFLAALANRKPLIISAWGTDILVTPYKNIVYKLITKYSLDKAVLVTSDSEFMTKKANELTSSEIITVPMGVEESLLKVGPKHETYNKILSLRTINKNSNIDIIVKGFKLYLERTKDNTAKLVIGNNGPEIENIKKLVNDLNLNDNVEFKGYMSRENLLESMLSADLHISIPTSDSTSVTLLETMAIGIPSIVSDLEANREWIEHDKNGLILCNNNEETLSEYIEYALNNEDFITNSMRINKQTISQRAIWTNNMMHIEEEYLKIITSAAYNKER